MAARGRHFDERFEINDATAVVVGGGEDDAAVVDGGVDATRKERQNDHCRRRRRRRCFCRVTRRENVAADAASNQDASEDFYVI